SAPSDQRRPFLAAQRDLDTPVALASFRAVRAVGGVVRRDRTGAAIALFDEAWRRFRQMGPEPAGGGMSARLGQCLVVLVGAGGVGVAGDDNLARAGCRDHL